jgi:hypothetical protein
MKGKLEMGNNKNCGGNDAFLRPDSYTLYFYNKSLYSKCKNIFLK